MKKLFAGLLLIGFGFQNFSQLGVLALFYIQRDDIAKTFCINRYDKESECKGSCHLDKQLRVLENKQEQQLLDIKYKEIQLFSAHNSDFNLNPVTFDSYSEKIPTTPNDIISTGFIFLIFHPPQKS